MIGFGFEKTASRSPSVRLLRELERVLREGGVTNARNEARWLLESSCNAGNVNSGNADNIMRLAERRVNGEPLQYLLGEWPFYGYMMRVGPGVLIPRPETELLVDVVREFFDNDVPVVHSRARPALISERGTPQVLKERSTFRSALDLCSGSGCLSVAIAKQCGCFVGAIDNAPDANYYADINAKNNGVEGYVKTVTGTVFAKPSRSSVGRLPVDVIVSNPPYLSAADMASLQKEVTFEPEQALYGGYDGLAFYKKLFVHWAPYLRRGGLFAVEVGDTQAEQVAGYMRQAGLLRISTKRDLSGTERVVLGHAR